MDQCVPGVAEFIIFGKVHKFFVIVSANYYEMDIVLNIRDKLCDILNVSKDSIMVIYDGVGKILYIVDIMSCHREHEERFDMFLKNIDPSLATKCSGPKVDITDDGESEAVSLPFGFYLLSNNRFIGIDYYGMVEIIKHIKNIK